MADYSLLEKIKIRLDEYDLVTPEGGEETVVFHVGKIDYKLNNLIDKARKDIIAYRHYPKDYKAEKIENDINDNWENILIDLVMYDYSINGADYESNHSENGVNRTFVKRESILGKVIPFCNVL